MENEGVSLYGRSKLYERDRNKYCVGGTVPKVAQLDPWRMDCRGMKLSLQSLQGN